MFGLPVEVLFKIFRLLPRSALIECLRVDKEFNAFLTRHAAFLWSNLVFKSHHRALASFSRYGGLQLQKLSIKNCKDNGVYSVLRGNNCTFIQQLDLSGNKLSKTALLNIVCDLGRKLTVLNLSNSFLSDAVLDKILRSTKYLQVLDVSRCSHLTASAFSNVKPIKLSALHSLNVSRCQGLKDQSLGCIVNQSPNLVTISVEGCTGLSFKTMKLIQTFCAKITNVKLTGITPASNTRNQFFWACSPSARSNYRLCSDIQSRKDVSSGLQII